MRTRETRINIRSFEEDAKVTLTNKERDIFLEALTNPPEPSLRLKAAMKRYRKNVKNWPRF